MTKLLELKKSYGEAVDKLEELAEAGGDAFDTQKALIGDIGAKIKRLEETNALKATTATTVDGQAATPAQVKVSTEKGARLSRAIVALAATKGIPQLAAQFAERTWGGDEGAILARALAVGSGAAGGFTVPEDFRNDLIELLRPASVVMSSGPRVIGMPNGNITIPRVATGANAEYVGENANAPKTGQTFGQITLTAKKLTALVPMSNDMLRYPTMSADSFVRDDLTQALAQRADLALLRSVGSQFAPKGLRQFAVEGGTGQFLTCSTTVNLVTVTAELARMELALMNANIPMVRPGWVMSPRSMVFLSNIRDANGNFAFPEMANGRLRGKPFKTTTQIPDNIGGTSQGSEIYLVEFNEYIVGEGFNLEIKVSEGGTYHDGTALVSGLSQDQTIITALMAHDAAMRQPTAVVVLNDVRWTL
jgi:HK97 family phage major capsid protein